MEMHERTFVLRNRDIARNMFKFVGDLYQGSEAPEPMLEVVIREHKKKRSLAQNRCFHAWMRELSQLYAEHYGEERAPWVWKEFMKRQFLGEESVDLRGEMISRTRRTRELGVKEFAEFLTRVDAWVTQELAITLARMPDYWEAMGR